MKPICKFRVSSPIHPEGITIFSYFSSLFKFLHLVYLYRERKLRSCNGINTVEVNKSNFKYTYFLNAFFVILYFFVLVVYINLFTGKITRLFHRGIHYFSLCFLK